MFGTERNAEIFVKIKRGQDLETLVPKAIEIIEKDLFVNFENPDDNEYSILEGCGSFFDSHPELKRRFAKIKKQNINKGNCLSRQTGKARKRYFSKESATEAADGMSIQYGAQDPYLCEQCGEWHLAPRSRSTPSRPCDHCTDRNGEVKQLYVTRADAVRRANIIKEEKGIELNVYECPAQDGWHLTKG